MRECEKDKKSAIIHCEMAHYREGYIFHSGPPNFPLTPFQSSFDFQTCQNLCFTNKLTDRNEQNHF